MHRMLCMEFKEKLIALCAEKKWKRSHLRDALEGVASKSTVDNIWNGKKPGTDAAIILARNFGVSVDYLMDDSLDEDPVMIARTENERAVLRYYRNAARDGHGAWMLGEIHALSKSLDRDIKAGVKYAVVTPPLTGVIAEPLGEEAPPHHRKPGGQSGR